MCLDRQHTKSKKDIDKFLKSESLIPYEQYEAYLAAADKIDKLLQFPEEYTWKRVLQLKEVMQAQSDGLGGYLVREDEFPTTIIKTKDEKTGKPLEIKVPNHTHPKVINVNGCYSLDFLHYQLFFFVCSYDYFLNNPSERDKEEEKLHIQKRLLGIYAHEIWIIVNAYLIRKRYSEIIRELKENDKLDLTDKINLSSFIGSLLDDILQGECEEYEYVIPGGMVGHAVYVTLLHKKNIQKLFIRIDNPSKPTPAYFECGKVTNLQVRSEVIRYLTEVCVNMKAANSDEADDPVDLIKDANPPFSFREIRGAYRPLRPQRGPNCVWHGFGLGQWYRLNNVGESRGEAVFTWLSDQIKFFHLTVIEPSPEDQQNLMREKIYKRKDSEDRNDTRKLRRVVASHDIVESKISLEESISQYISVQPRASQSINGYFQEHFPTFFKKPQANCEGFKASSTKLKKLENINFAGALFMKSDFTGANLRGGNLSSADFSGANFSNAALAKANLAQTQLENATITEVIGVRSDQLAEARFTSLTATDEATIKIIKRASDKRAICILEIKCKYNAEIEKGIKTACRNNPSAHLSQFYPHICPEVRKNFSEEELFYIDSPAPSIASSSLRKK